MKPNCDVYDAPASQILEGQPHHLQPGRRINVFHLTTVGELVNVNKEKAKIIVTADMAFSKRYLKYLAKKYLKKHSVRTSLNFLMSVSCLFSVLCLSGFSQS